MKKLLLIVVDACASRILQPAMQQGKLPHIQALAEIGLLEESIAVFPSLTPAATASIATGEYPRRHGILGFHWYDLEENKVVYYGDDFWVIWNKGFGEVFKDFYELNERRLQQETLFQIIERANLTVANLNYLIYRGEVKHQANVPLWLSLLPGVPFSEEITGSSIMYFGDLVNTELAALEQPPDRSGGLLNRFGFDDDNTADLLLSLAGAGALPDFTIAYFPDNDFNSHAVGPDRAVTTLEHVDARLGELVGVFGGREAMLEQLCLILTGDHSQSDMTADEERAGIRLDLLLADFSIAENGKTWQAHDQLVVCPDMRSAQIYFQTLNRDEINTIVDRLLADDRVDQVLWRAAVLDEAAPGYWAATRQGGRLHFWPVQEEAAAGAKDQYGGLWKWEGNLETVDGRVTADKRLTFPTYPNAFERIAGGLAPQNGGHLWVTARPGYEFCLPETAVHIGGGSHGSLHILDSLSPLLVAGAPAGVTLPAHPRAVDIAPLCLTILGLEPAYPAGRSHITGKD